MAGSPSPVGYVLVTALRDELALLGDLVASVRAQEHPPSRWILVDDRSSDGTGAGIEALARREPWIHAIHRTARRADDRASGYAEALVEGLRAAPEVADADGVDYRFVVTLDADARCRPHVLAELVGRAAADRRIGIAACRVMTQAGGSWTASPAEPCGMPHGAPRAWRRECLEETAFYVTPQWPSVTAMRARNRGWETPVYPDLVVECVRSDGVRGGWWSGHRRQGEAAWQVGLHPALVAAHALAASRRQRDLRGIAVLAGWLDSAVRGRRRAIDPEVREYFGTQLPRERVRALVERCRELVRYPSRG